MISMTGKLGDLDFIIARREVTYSLSEIKACLLDVGIEDPSEDYIIEFIHGWISDDFGCPWGHELDRNDEITYFDSRYNKIDI